MMFEINNGNMCVCVCVCVWVLICIVSDLALIYFSHDKDV